MIPFIELDLTHEFRREQNRRKLHANRSAFVAGLYTGCLVCLGLLLLVHLFTR